jgi:hypothetical protein
MQTFVHLISEAQRDSYTNTIDIYATFHANDLPILHLLSSIPNKNAHHKAWQLWVLCRNNIRTIQKLDTSSMISTVLSVVCSLSMQC